MYYLFYSMLKDILYTSDINLRTPFLKEKIVLEGEGKYVDKVYGDITKLYTCYDSLKKFIQE